MTVKEVDHDLSAVIWDADSQSWFSTFNTKTIPNYKKLTEQASRQQIMAAATDTAGITYAASYEEKDGNLYSTLYQVGKDYSLTKIGDSEVAYTDMTFAEKLNGGLQPVAKASSRSIPQPVLTLRAGISPHSSPRTSSALPISTPSTTRRMA